MTRARRQPLLARPRFRRGLGVATTLYGVVLLFVLFEPSNSVPSSSILWISTHLRDAGWPVVISGFGYVDFWCNILIMVPLAAALVLLWPRVRWERWTVVAFSLSAIVETSQALFFPNRVPAFSDVVANTMGVLLGSAGSALLWWWRVQRRPVAV